VHVGGCPRHRRLQPPRPAPPAALQGWGPFIKHCVPPAIGLVDPYVVHRHYWHCNASLSVRQQLLVSAVRGQPQSVRRQTTCHLWLSEGGNSRPHPGCLGWWLSRSRLPPLRRRWRSWCRKRNVKRVLLLPMLASRASGASTRAFLCTSHGAYDEIVQLARMYACVMHVVRTRLRTQFVPWYSYACMYVLILACVLHVFFRRRCFAALRM
jgi:hypothetical protein